MKKVALEAAEEAGSFIMSRCGNIGNVSYKEGVNNLVTEVDRASEDLIVRKIKARFPGHSILAEESGDHASDSEVRWIIDPIDGTTNYTHGFPFFCVSIGVTVGGATVLGVVYDPTRSEMFSAVEGKGAFLGDRPIKVSLATRVEDSLIATGFAYNPQGKVDNIRHFDAMLRKAQAVRRAGSAALDLCYVACGRFDGFWELGLNPWDTAAGELIVREAGGAVSTISGGPFDIFTKEIAATNGYIHKEMLKVLSGANI